MIIKNAAFNFDLLTNKLSRSKEFDRIGVLKGQQAIAGLVLVQPWTVIIEKILRIVISRSFFKKNSSFSMLIKEQNNSYQSSLLIGPNGFLNSFKLMYPFPLLESLWSF